jgi:DNA modification methylase
LRDYGTAKWKGGDPKCEHLVRENPATETSTLGGGKDSTGHQREEFKSVCPRCGAKRIDQQLGLEKTPEEYVQKLVAIFREVRRVLRADGTVWLNLSDSYFGSGQGFGDTKTTNKNHPGSRERKKPKWNDCGLKPKDLVGIPWRVAFALQADGWYLRQDIIWAKPNPMPESVTDRCTKSHEYIFLLTKSARYFYDAEAIKEPTVTYDDNVRDRETTRLNNVPGRRKMKGLTENNFESRNKRSVWTVPTSPYREAHFATFSPDLIKPCILAGTKLDDVVLDPFAGSFTTCMVSLELGRQSIGIELNPKYVELGKQWCAVTPGLPL